MQTTKKVERKETINVRQKSKKLLTELNVRTNTPRFVVTDDRNSSVVNSGRLKNYAEHSNDNRGGEDKQE